METVRLGDVCDVRDGTHDSPKYHDSGYPLVTSKNLSKGFVDFTDCNLISKEDYDKINIRSKVDVGDILMPMIGTVGNPVIVKIEPEFAIKNVALIKFYKYSRVLNKYIKVLLESNYFDRTVISKIRGGTQKFISLNDIRGLEIILPPISEQLEIVDRIEKVNVLINKRKKQLEKLDELVKARFVELFGDLILNQKSFTEGCVSDYCKMTQGTQIPMSEQISEYTQGYYRYLYIRDLKYNDDNWIYVQDKYDDKKLTEKDLVVVNTGNTAGEIYYGKDGILSNNLFKVSFDTDILNITYMFAYFSSQQFQNMLWSEMKEGTQPHLGHKIFGSKKLLVPPIELQNQFAAFVEQTDKSKLEVQKSLEKLKLLKKALMQKYFG